MIGGVLASAALFCFSYAAFAQTSGDAAQTVTDRQAALEKELSEINLEISGLTNTIGGLKNEKSSLDRDIKLLNANIARANLNIKAKNLEISKLSDGIADKRRTVRTLSQQIERQRQSLAQLLRKTSEIDQITFTEAILSSEGISELFIDLDEFDALRRGLKDSTDALKSARVETEQVQQELEDRQSKETNARAELERNKRLVEQSEKEKQRLLSITKNKEKEYTKVLDDRKKRAASIRAALFALRDSGEIQFGTAYEYAQEVGRATGVRPAFLLAIFQQESSFGKNQGSCYLKDPKTGSGIGAKSGSFISRVMKPDRDVEPFLRITQAVGRDPYNTRVSCPQEVGWGGAMGAAQFIPSTWILYESRASRALGVDAVDPWNPRDAFMAAGMYLADIGAANKTYSSERDAACRYFSGRRCSQSSWAATYGSQVMSKATNIQENMIDPLQNG